MLGEDGEEVEEDKDEDEDEDGSVCCARAVSVLTVGMASGCAPMPPSTRAAVSGVSGSVL